MEITPADIVEELRPLMMSELADQVPSVRFGRFVANRVLLDFGLPATVFTLTGEAEPRS